MRPLRLVFAAALLLALAIPATGQGALPSGRIRVGYFGPEPLALEQGGNATFHLEFSRECTDLELVLPETSLQVHHESGVPLTFSGASQVTFPDQVCATQRVVAANETYSLSVPLNTTVGTHNVTITTTVEGAFAPGPGTEPLTLNCEVTPATPGTPTLTTTNTDEPVPGFALVPAALACVALALARRRR